MNKIAIIGAGRVGETAAQMLAEKETCREIALLDVREDAARGCLLYTSDAADDLYTV